MALYEELKQAYTTQVIENKSFISDNFSISKQIASALQHYLDLPSDTGKKSGAGHHLIYLRVDSAKGYIPSEDLELRTQEQHLLVQCKSLLRGEAAESVCSVACNACGRCAIDAEAGLIEMIDGLAVIDYDSIQLENPKAIERCPTKAIVWLEGQQFPGVLDSVGSEAA